MSYRISIELFSEANWSKSPHRQMTITAEGEYDSVTGHLCMVGCRKTAPSYTERDCDILVKLEFASLDISGMFLRGSMESTTPEMDPLHFPDLSFSSSLHSSFSSVVAHDNDASLRPMWRLGRELIMLETSNALSCTFVWRQIRHVRRRPEVASSISLLMILMLFLGHIISVVSNFQILFPSYQKNQNEQALQVNFEEKLLQTDKVTSMLISVIEFCLHMRLFYIVWNAKSNQRGNRDSSWIRQRTASLILLSLCISGCLLTPLLSAALMLDAFLLPQILLSILRGAAEKALCAAFYAGMSALRLAPRAYSYYRKHNYPTSFNVEEKCYYANPAVYPINSAAWDVIIPSGVIALALIVFLQQWHGGRCVLSQRFNH